jgi:uncharacterized membrane protein YbhN (UPF0104 family)
MSDDPRGVPQEGNRSLPLLLLRTVGILIGVAGGLFVVRILATQWADVRYTIQHADPSVLILAYLLGLLGMAQIGLGWGHVIRIYGERAPLIAVLTSYFIGQLGKYVPGGIWPVVGRSELARRAGVSGSTAYASTLLSVGLTYFAAALTAGLVLPFGGQEGTNPVLTWGVGVGSAGLVLLLIHPTSKAVVAGRLRRRASSDPTPDIPDWKTLTLLLTRHVMAWLTIALATFEVCRAFGASGVFLNVVFATTFAWLAGFLALPVPGGLGVREAAFIATATSLPVSLAATVAVTARLLFVTVDASAAVVLYLLPSGGVAGSSRSAD